MPKPPKVVEEDPDPSEWLFISMEMKRQDAAIPYDGKTACWVPDVELGYVRGEIRGTKGDMISVAVPNGEVKDFKKDLVLQCNPPKYEKCEDMINLTYLNDAAVLHNLRQRYLNKFIYVCWNVFHEKYANFTDTWPP